MNVNQIPSLDEREHIALRAVVRGEASADQQTLALHTIIEKFARCGEVPFKEGSPDGTAFLAGRYHVGKLILAASKSAPRSQKE